MPLKTANRLQMTRETLVLVSAYSTPFWGVFLSKEGTYLSYVLTAIIGFYAWKKVPVLLYCLVLYSMFLMVVYMQSLASIIDLFSILIATAYSISVAFALRAMPVGVAIKKLLTYSISTLAIAFVLSIALSGPLGILNPLTLLHSGGRLQVLATGGGHSILNELAALALICLSVGDGFIRGQLAARIFLSVLLLLAGSSTAILVLGTIWVVSYFEGNYRKSNVKLNLIRTAAHVMVLSAIAFVALNPVLTNSMMKEIRQIASQENNSYYGDYTAGRSQLNELLIATANESPYLGFGDEHPVLEYGVTLITGKEKGASSESPVRLAVKFGWPFFALNALTWLAPLCLGFFQKGVSRRFLILSGYTALIFTSTNAGFSTPQSSTFVIFGPILWFAILGQGRHLSFLVFRRPFVETH